jgi:hypothetical protein
MDSEFDYYLAPLPLTLTPKMSAFDVINKAALHWAEFPIMNEFVVSTISFSEAMTGCLSITLWADVETLDADAVDQMPFDDDLPVALDERREGGNRTH